MDNCSKFFKYNEVETYLRVNDLRTNVWKGALFRVVLALSWIEVLNRVTPLIEPAGPKSPRTNRLTRKSSNDNKGMGDFYVGEG